MTTPTLNTQEITLINLINSFRQQNGVPPLQVSAALTNAAKWMANDMASKNYLNHTDSQGRDPFVRMTGFGYNAQTLRGENVAAGNPDAQGTFNSWRDACDPNPMGTCTYAHRQNMLNPQFVVIGVGEAYNPNSTFGYYWAADFGGTLDTTIPITSVTQEQMGSPETGIQPSTPTMQLTPGSPETGIQPNQPSTPTMQITPTRPQGTVIQRIPGAQPPGFPLTTPGALPNLPGTPGTPGISSYQPGVLVAGQCLCPVSSTIQLQQTSANTSWIWLIIIIVILIIAGVIYFVNRK